MRRGLKIREFIVERDRKLIGVYEEETGQVYFSIQALAKTAGYTPQQAKDLKKRIIYNNSLKNLIEFREIPTFEEGQKGWVIYQDMLPNFMLLFPRLRILSKAFSSNNLDIEEAKQNVIYELDSIFPSLNRARIFLHKNESSNQLVYIREFKPRVSIKALSEFFSIEESSIIKHISLSEEKYGEIEYNYMFKDLTFEAFVLLNTSNFFSNNNIHILVNSFISAQNSLVNELYTSIVKEISNNLSQVYIIENPLTGLVKIGISNRVEKRTRELSGGGQTQLFVVYASKLISNAKEIKDLVMEKLKDHKKFGEWFDINSGEALKIIKSYEKEMFIKNPTF